MSIGLYKTCSNFWHSVCLDYKLMPKFIDAGFYWNNKASIDKFGPALNKNLWTCQFPVLMKNLNSIPKKHINSSRLSWYSFLHLHLDFFLRILIMSPSFIFNKLTIRLNLLFSGKTDDFSVENDENCLPSSSSVVKYPVKGTCLMKSATKSPVFDLIWPLSRKNTSSLGKNQVTALSHRWKDSYGIRKGKFLKNKALN